MRKMLHRMMIGIAAAALWAAAPVVRAQTLLVDTGSGNASGGHALFNSPPNFNFLACKFTLGSAFTIGTVQGWMVRPSGTIVLKLCANSGGNLPGSVLASQNFPVTFGGFSAAWTSFIVSGAAWSQPAGTYWICFECTTGTTSGSMPGNAPTPLSNTAYFTNGNPGYVLNGAGDMNGRYGLRLYTPAPPSPINVPAQQPTIQAGINAASLPSQEVIVAPGTYNEAINFNGKTIIVRSSGGSGVTTINATGTNTHAVTIGSGSAAGTRLEGFNITGGSTTGRGGGVLVSSATALIKDCDITANHADSGGGVAAELLGNATFQNCNLLNNTADTAGGGAYVNGATLTLTQCTLETNTSAADAGGLDVNNNGTATVTNCLFDTNTSGNAGGGVVIIGTGANATFNTTDFINNTAAQAGGVYVNIGSGGFTNCQFLDNHATFVGGTSGGGLQAQGTGTSVTLTTCDFADNDAAYGAGAEFLAFNGTATITDCNFSDNIASIQGGGIYRGFGGSNNPSVGTSAFCGNSPNHINGSFTNSGGNTFNVACSAAGGDLNGDGHVDVNDLLSVISAWGNCPAAPASCTGDTNNDGIVDVNDLLTVITHWG